MKEFWVYTALRLALFLGAAGIVFGVWALFGTVSVMGVVIIAFIVSGVGSYFLLSVPRERLARRVEPHAQRASTRLDEMRSKEDVD